jgi:hypothetical protein
MESRMESWADIDTAYLLTENQAVRTYLLWNGKRVRFIRNDDALRDRNEPFFLYAAKDHVRTHYAAADTFPIRNEYLTVVRK